MVKAPGWFTSDRRLRVSIDFIKSNDGTGGLQRKSPHGSLSGANQILRAAISSCGAAVEGRPRIQPWIAVLVIGAAKRRKEILLGRNAVAPDRAFGDGPFFPTARAVGPLAPHRGRRLARPLPKSDFAPLFTHRPADSVDETAENFNDC